MYSLVTNVITELFLVISAMGLGDADEIWCTVSVAVSVRPDQ